MQIDCQHFVQKKEKIYPNTKNCEECEKEHLPIVALTNVSHMWACRML